MFMDRNLHPFTEYVNRGSTPWQDTLPDGNFGGIPGGKSQTGRATELFGPSFLHDRSPRLNL